MGRGEPARVAATELSSGTPVADKRFIWCGSSPCVERQLLPVSATKQLFDYGTSAPGSNYFHVFDHLGSVREVTDASGVLVQRLSYDPWGRQTLVSGSTVSAATYAQQMDFAGGLSLAVHRGYSPELGRWLSQDPIGLGDGPNMYAYVTNNPIGRIDPSGLFGFGIKRDDRGNVVRLRQRMNTIVCDGQGTVRPHAGDMHNECLVLCVLVHESTHKQDADAWSYGVCKDQPEWAIVASEQDTTAWTENNAHCAEIDCLESISKKPCPGEQGCDPYIKDRIKQISGSCKR
jgi:RHS repeat-associated protein